MPSQPAGARGLQIVVICQTIVLAGVIKRETAIFTNSNDVK